MGANRPAAMSFDQHAFANLGDQTRAELTRLQRLLDAAAAGETAPREG
jgi:hypothetical protein